MKLKRIFPIALGLFVTGVIALTYAPRLIGVPALKMDLTKLASCKLPDGRPDNVTSAGGPSQCLIEWVQKYHGTAFTGYIVNFLWADAQKHFNHESIDPLWRNLAKTSVENIESIEWPLFFYANVPILKNIYAPNSHRSCIERLRAGSRCENWNWVS